MRILGIILAIIFPTIEAKTELKVQKYICKICEKSYYSDEQKHNKLMKLHMKYTASKLAIILRFKQGASIRNIGEINKQVFGMYHSAGYINSLCTEVSLNATKRMEGLKYCNQKNAEVMMLDETFPRSKEEKATNMGVVADENGLIRGIELIKNKKVDLNKLLSKVLSTKYSPQYFMSDYDTMYPGIAKELSPEIQILKDFVHAGRQILKESRTAINQVKVSQETLNRFTKTKQKEMTKLKKRLMRKHLYKVIRTILKGFKKGNVAVGTLYLEGGLEDLYRLSQKYPSLKPLYVKLCKFINKYLECWNLQMELYNECSIPLTSNIIESLNSIFKAFSKKAKSYCIDNMENFFNTVALFNNFDIKQRGKNKGTSAMMRAGIDLEEFGGGNFYEAVGLYEIIFGDPKSRLSSETLGYYHEIVA